MNEGSLYNQRKEFARHLYMNEDMPIRDIAVLVNADEATIREWIKAGAWEGLKCSLLISKKNQLKQYYSELQKIDQALKEDKNPNPKNMDAHLKYTTYIKNLEVQLTPSEIIEVFDTFTRWLRRKDPALTQKLVVHLDAYVKQKMAA